jgi:hypothetical protein
MRWIKRNAGVNVVMQRKRVAMKIESPVDTVEVIFLLAKINMKIFAENIGNLVESFQTTVIINPTRYEDLGALIDDHGAIVAADGMYLALWSTAGAITVVEQQRVRPAQDDFGSQPDWYLRYTPREVVGITVTNLPDAATAAKLILESLNQDDDA